MQVGFAPIFQNAAGSCRTDKCERELAVCADAEAELIRRADALHKRLQVAPSRTLWTSHAFDVGSVLK
jgi:hypothetical protein